MKLTKEHINNLPFGATLIVHCGTIGEYESSRQMAYRFKRSLKNEGVDLSVRMDSYKGTISITKTQLDYENENNKATNSE